MTARIDHIVVVAPSLEAGADLVHRSLGHSPGPGRKHPHMGTHNLLLSLGNTTYLEVVAIDPEAGATSRSRWFGLDDLESNAQPSLAAWVAETDDIRSAASPELGEVERMERNGLTWHMTTTPTGRLPLAGGAPLLIQRTAGPHPASRLPDLGLRLRRLRVRHPDPGRLNQLAGNIGLHEEERFTLEEWPVCMLLAEIETPLVLRTLGKVCTDPGQVWLRPGGRVGTM